MSSVFAAKYAVDGIVKGDYANVFVVQRPPGRHLATRAVRRRELARLCFMNGAAIAAEYYLLKGPGARVTIIDCELRRRPPAHHPRLSRMRLRDSRPAPRERHAECAEEPSIQFVDFHKETWPGTGSTSDAHRNVINVEFAQDYTYGVKAKG